MQRFLLATLAVSLLGAASAMAGPLWSSPNGAEGAWQNSEPRPVAARQPNFGGGLFEFLATGGRGMRANPPPTYGAQPPSLLARGEPEPDPRRGFDPRFRRQIVDFSGGENPGTIVIDTRERFLYLVEDAGRAIQFLRSRADEYNIDPGRIAVNEMSCAPTIEPVSRPVSCCGKNPFGTTV